jgi:hypothetical protein
MVIGQVMPVGGPVSESRGVILQVRDSRVVEYWSLADEPALGRQLGLRAGPATPAPASVLTGHVVVRLRGARGRRSSCRGRAL